MAAFLRRHIPPRRRQPNDMGAEADSVEVTVDGKKVEAQRGSWSGTPLTDTPEQQSLRSSYGSGVQQITGPADPNSPLHALQPAPVPELEDAERTPVVRAADQHSSVKVEVREVKSNDSTERRPLLEGSESTAQTEQSDPFRTPVPSLSDPFQTPETSYETAKSRPDGTEKDGKEGAGGEKEGSGSKGDGKSHTGSTPAPLSPRSSPPDSPNLDSQQKHKLTPTPRMSFRPLEAPAVPPPPSKLAQKSYRPRPESISSSSGDEAMESGPGLHALDILATRDVMAAGARSLAWLEELCPFYGPVPASLVGGRFPPVELVLNSPPKGWPLARARQVSRQGSAGGSVHTSRSASPSASVHPESSAPPPQQDAAPEEEHLTESAYGSKKPAKETEAADGGESVARPRSRSTEPVHPPQPLNRRLRLTGALSGRTFSAWTGGKHNGAKRVVKFFLGSESLMAQNEARAYELLEGSGLTSSWHGAWGGFHPHMGHITLKAGQVLMLACVLGDAGGDVSVDSMTNEEKLAVVELYKGLHARGVLHNTPGAEHWQRDGEGKIKVVSFSQALFKANLPDQVWKDAVEAEEHLVRNILRLTLL